MKTNKIRKIISFVLAIYTMFCLTITASAEGGNAISESAIGKGIIALLSDVGKYGALIAIPVTVVVVVFCQIRKAMSDEQDEKKWSQWTKRALIGGILAVSAGSLVSLIFGYFTAS